MLYFNLNDTPDADNPASIEILESDGTLIKRFETKEVVEGEEQEDDGTSLEAKAGANLFVWDMRYPDAVSFDGIILYSSNTKGPVAVPGTYRARLNFGGQSVEQEFEILKDPRVLSSQADLQAQFDFLILVRDKLSEANQAVIDIRKLYTDLDYLEAKLEDDPESDDILVAIASLPRTSVRYREPTFTRRAMRRIRIPFNFGIKLNNRLAYIATHESAGDFPPTDQGEAYYYEVSAQIDQEIAALNELLEQGVPEINLMLGIAGNRDVGNALGQCRSKTKAPNGAFVFALYQTLTCIVLFLGRYSISGGASPSPLL